MINREGQSDVATESVLKTDERNSLEGSTPSPSAKCFKCGFCCVKYEVILLTKEEVAEKKFRTKKHPYSFESETFSDMVLDMKRVYVSVLGEVREVCCYFDEERNLCLTHSDKPIVCLLHFCSRWRK
jgi:Fe-S-cluster containining protein